MVDTSLNYYKEVAEICLNDNFDDNNKITMLASMMLNIHKKHIAEKKEIVEDCEKLIDAQQDLIDRFRKTLLVEKTSEALGIGFSYNPDPGDVLSKIATEEIGKGDMVKFFGPQKCLVRKVDIGKQMSERGDGYAMEDCSQYNLVKICYSDISDLPLNK